jgi:hypothetical protein
MKVDLQITKDGAALLANVYDVTDADSFANACADLWWKMERQAARCGDSLPRPALERLVGAQLSVVRI